MATYRSVSRARMDSKPGRELTYARLIDLLHHLEGFGVTLVAMTISASEIQIEISDDIPARQATHLGLEKVA